MTETATGTGGHVGNLTGDTALIAFDGSDEARTAIREAARFLSSSTAYILTAWEPIHRQAARAAGMSGMMQHDWASTAAEEDDDPAYREAVAICREGVELARSHGFTTEPYLVESATAVWSAIVDAAEELDVDVIVAGTRALSGWKSLLQSSVSDSIVKHAGRPVLIVPPAGEGRGRDGDGDGRADRDGRASGHDAPDTPGPSATPTSR
ncbi:universal stress protein UspA [Corynebacterium bovis]|uniref:Universal stress protein UspA n=1 Tax=Corynebacterium bovis TaxID=36808 RepID=A0A426Q3I7_9CORY|nr:universal stress protein UspA [Corynebacterium bovis]RRO99098.1 universal stress protein UspA [Corynebacterium bovis]RRQ03242.1 universal stress protein UspA [Corynebacterium bovis]RRQ05979.1 universal stress protein UspA [Corynebacterium bovis]RRQ10488.1 universal stress protein UspA [Corynebacterium bovis]